MNPLINTQPFFRIEVKRPSGEWLDISSFVELGVRYEEQADLIRTLTFTVHREGQFLVSLFHYGQAVRFHGGHLKEYANLFNGTVMKLRQHYGGEGFVRLTIECMATTWNQLAKKVHNNFVYPDTNNTRFFKELGDKVPLDKLVRKICEVNDIELAYMEPIENMPVFDLNNQIHQYRMSDWALLRKLAKKVNCTVWTEFRNGDEKLYFGSITKVRENAFHTDNKEPVFLYPLHGSSAGNFGTPNADYGYINKQYHDEVILREVDIEEDMATMNSISYAASKFDFESGEEVAVMAKVEERDGKKYIVYQTLDYDKIERFRKVNPALADRYANEGIGGNLTWDEIEPFLKNIDQPIPEDSAPYDNAFYGVTLTASCNGNIAIRSQRAYNIHGITLHATGLTSTRFWLYSMVHSWGSDGFKTEMTFKK